MTKNEWREFFQEAREALWGWAARDAQRRAKTAELKAGKTLHRTRHNIKQAEKFERAAELFEEKGRNR